MTVGSDFGIKKLSGAFKYNGEFLKFGSPRNDKLINNSSDEVNRVKSF